MSNEAKTLKIKELAEGLLSADPTIFLVRVHIRPINNISVYVDGDQGVTIDKCVKLNRALYKQIVEEGVCPDGEFALEVSSPGVDEPLVMERQYTKNIGRVVEVTDNEGKMIEGKLLSATAEGIEIEEEKGKGKKKPEKEEPVAEKPVEKTPEPIVVPEAPPVEPEPEITEPPTPDQPEEPFRIERKKLEGPTILGRIELQPTPVKKPVASSSNVG